jgi:hypothetical protein
VNARESEEQMSEEMNSEPMDEDECIDDTDLCEHGLRFGCEDC